MVVVKTILCLNLFFIILFAFLSIMIFASNKPVNIQNGYFNILIAAIILIIILEHLFSDFILYKYYYFSEAFAGALGATTTIILIPLVIASFVKLFKKSFRKTFLILLIAISFYFSYMAINGGFDSVKNGEKSEYHQGLRDKYK